MREFSLPALYEVPPGGNLTDLIHRNAERTPDVAVVSRKVQGQWADLTAAEFLTEVHRAAKGLVASGVQPGDRVGLMSRTRYEWTLLDFAIWCAGAITVPVYETSSAEQVEWILGDSGAVAVIVETDTHAQMVAKARANLPALDHVWVIEDAGLAQLQQLGADVHPDEIYQRRMTRGAVDLAEIVYTSGTTGRP